MSPNANGGALAPGELRPIDPPPAERPGGRTRRSRGRSPARIHEPAAGSGSDAPSDLAMLGGFQRGDPEAARAFVRRFQGRVYGLAVKMTGDPVWADDIAQEAFLRAWRGASSFDPARGSVTTWLLTITRNAALDGLRRHRPESVSPHAEAFLQLAAADPLPADVVALEDEMGAVRTALRRIPLEQRRAVVLASLFRLTAPEIADTEGVPLGTAKTRVRSGMLKLRSELPAKDARLPDSGD